MHACHGHMYRPSPVPLSGTGKKGGREKGGWAKTGGGSKGAPPALAATREYKQFDRNR